jgi:hypothetical protein
MGLQLSGSVQLEGNLLVTGSANSVFENITVTNRITANEINVQFVSSSIIYSSGSNRFGDEITDNHQFTGSLRVSGSSHIIIGNSQITGSVIINGSISQIGVGTNNIIISDASKPNSGAGNTIVGASAANNITTGGDNTFLGYGSGFQNSVGFWNTFVGSVAGGNNVSGSYNTFVGTRAGYNNINAENNTFIGRDAGLANTTGLRNTFIGSQSGLSNQSGNYNTFLGFYSGQGNIAGNYNTCIGDSSGLAWRSGVKNTLLGDNSGGGINFAVGSYNTLLGAETGYNIISGSENTFVGYQAGLANNNGNANVGVGMRAGYYNATGSSNVFIGHEAGLLVQAGTNNTNSSASIYIGRDTRSNVANQVNQIVIGHQAIGNGSNTVTIGNSSITDTYLRGNVVATGSLFVSGTLAMGTADKGVGRISFNESTNALRIQSSKDGTDCTPIEFWSQRPGGVFAQSMIISGSNTGIGTLVPTERFNVNVGGGARAGMALTGEYPYLKFNVTASSANSRNWAFSATNLEAGDFALLQSNAKDGDPVTAGTRIIDFSRSGNATFSGNVTSPSFSTTNTTQSIPFTTWTDVLNMDGKPGIFAISVQLDYQTADEWAASGIVMSTGTNSGVTAQYLGTQNDGTYVQTRISGTKFQVYQNGTSPSLSLSVRILKIG